MRKESRLFQFPGEFEFECCWSARGMWDPGIDLDGENPPRGLCTEGSTDDIQRNGWTLSSVHGSVLVKGKEIQSKKRRKTGDCVCLSLFVCVCLLSVKWSPSTVTFSNVFFTRMIHASPYLPPILYSPPSLPHRLVIWIHTGESLALHCLMTPSLTVSPWTDVFVQPSFLQWLFINT